MLDCERDVHVGRARCQRHGKEQQLSVLPDQGCAKIWESWEGAAQGCSTGLHTFSLLYIQITECTFYHSLCSNQMLSGNLLFLTSATCGRNVNLGIIWKNYF